jgi:hypothetical protein
MGTPTLSMGSYVQVFLFNAFDTSLPLSFLVSSPPSLRARALSVDFSEHL